MRYAIVIEKGPTSYGAYVPDPPGCVAVAKTAAEVKRLIAEAVPLHLEGLGDLPFQSPPFDASKVAFPCGILPMVSWVNSPPMKKCSGPGIRHTGFGFNGPISS